MAGTTNQSINLIKGFMICAGSRPGQIMSFLLKQKYPGTKVLYMGKCDVGFVVKDALAFGLVIVTYGAKGLASAKREVRLMVAIIPMTTRMRTNKTTEM